MKVSFLLIMSAIATVTTVTTAAQLKIPSPSPTQTIKQAFGLSDVVLEYSRPGAKNRTVFGGLVPYGTTWRTGANASTKVTFGDDVSIGGQGLKAGSYALYTIPKEDEWDVIFYSDLNLDGNFNEYDKSKEILRIKEKSMKTGSYAETFTMQFQNLTDSTMELEMRWADIRVVVPIKAEVDARVMKNIDSLVSKDSRPYFQAANYYYTNNKDLEQALRWTDKAIVENPNGLFIYALKARIQLKQKNRSAAASTARNVIKMATESGNDNYILIGKDLLKQAQD